MLVFAEIKMFICINKKEGKKMTEEQLKEALVDLYEEFKEEMTFDEFADRLDFWVDKDDRILIEDRGMKPIEGVKRSWTC